MNNIQIYRDSSFISQLESNLESEKPLSSWELFQMAYEAELTTMTRDFKGLISLQYLPHMTLLPYQVKAAEKAIEEMNGRAILADEVGLGKTIEAGLILKEYMVRGLVRKTLILVPASLVNQWVQELNEKFYIPAIAHKKNYVWNDYDVIVSSLDKAKRSPHREEIEEISYDFVLVDEAHKLKNDKTINYAFVRSIKKKYCLLLTATPIQNQLMEIFNLISILKPGHLGSYDSFLKKFGKDRKKIKQNSFLKKLVQKVMIRNTRSDTVLDNVKRKIETIWLEFSPEELNVYKRLDTKTASLPSFAKLTFLRELCSSREACYLSLNKMTKQNNDIKHIITEIEQLPHHIKAKKVVDLIKEIGDEKVIIFTEYRATQHYLQWFLQQDGISSVPFRGGFNKGKKDWMKQLFKNHSQVLIATEAGSEGINLQFCNHLINYDLPWNPMKLEQRIGRIHRYGQNKDVHIYNFAIRETIEEHVVKLLYEKINLFENVIGHLNEILAELNIDDLESEIKRTFNNSSSIGEAKIKLNNLSSIIQQTNEHMMNEVINDDN